MVTEGVLNPSSSEHKYAKHFYSFVHVEYKTCFPLKKEWLSCVALHCRLIFTCMCTSLSCESIYNIPCYTDGVWHMCMESCWQRISLSLWSYGICIAWELTKMPAVHRGSLPFPQVWGREEQGGTWGLYCPLHIRFQELSTDVYWPCSLQCSCRQLLFPSPSTLSSRFRASFGCSSFWKSRHN